MRKKRVPKRRDGILPTFPDETIRVDGSAQSIRYPADPQQPQYVKLDIPAGAIQGAARALKFWVANSSNPEIDIVALNRGGEVIKGFRFHTPAKLTISYADFDVEKHNAEIRERCEIFLLKGKGGPGKNRELDKDLGGIDDEVEKTVATSIQHLSGYTVAGGRAEAG